MSKDEPKKGPVKISIISAFHDQLPYNEIFWEMLNRYTYHSFELIMVDNASSDGSAEFFRNVGAIVVSQSRNCNYSEAMNIGTEKAIGEFICHMNNDIIVGMEWDRILIEAMELHSLDIASPASMELMPTHRESKKTLRRWRRIGGPDFPGTKGKIIEKWERMYGDWKDYCVAFEKRNKRELLDAINGHTVMIRGTAWKKSGPYDERMLATDWDLYLRTKKREVIYHDIAGPRVVLSAYVHHFMGTTARVTKCAYDCKEDTIYDIQDKWSMEELLKYWPFPMHLTSPPKLTEYPIGYLRFAFKSFFNLYKWGDHW